MRAHLSVAPRAGAWIETADSAEVSKKATVAPRAGAWIETDVAAAERDALKGRAPCGRVD